MEKARRAAHLGERQTRSFSGGVSRALLSSLLLGAILLFALSYLLYRTPDRAGLLMPIGFAGSGLLSLLGGYLGGRSLGRSGALCGITAGIILVFLFTLIALILRAGVLPVSAIPLYLTILAASTAGGAMGTRKRKKRPGFTKKNARFLSRKAWKRFPPSGNGWMRHTKHVSPPVILSAQAL